MNGKYSVEHPLQFITPEEIREAASLIKATFPPTNRIFFTRLDLKEPENKDYVLQYDDPSFAAQQKPLPPVYREISAVILDKSAGQVWEYDVVVGPPEAVRVSSARVVERVQPPFLAEEYDAMEKLVKSDTRVIALLKKRGIDDIAMVMVDLWTGFFDDPERRVGKPLMFLKTHEKANGYARPIDGIDIAVDLNKMEIIKVTDLFFARPPLHDPLGEWLDVKDVRKDEPKPIVITQPEGVSFRVDGEHIQWQNWDFRIGFNQFDGVVLHTIKFNDKGKWRPVMYRVGYSEMVVPYGDPRHPNYLKNAFDGGEDGLGRNCHSLDLGCDCVGSIHYLDVCMSDGHGVPYTLTRAICLHEEDMGTLWKHKDWRTGRSETRRNRRLVVSFFATIANYDYGFFWYLYLDGTFKGEVKLTGILSTSSIATGTALNGFGTMIGPNLYAPIHQHFFNVRLDTQVDGRNNAVQEVNVRAAKDHEPNPYKAGFRTVETTFYTENEAKRIVSPLTGRHWKIVNPSVRNRAGNLTAWRLVPGPSPLPFAQPESKIIQRAGWLNQTIWVTPFHPKELHPSGNYPCQMEIKDGLSEWTKKNRNIFNTDLVVWYTMGITHIVRCEDWPVMPAEHCSFELKPDNFFDISPVMDLPKTTDKVSCCATPALTSKL